MVSRFSLKSASGVTISEAGVPAATVGYNPFRMYAEVSGGASRIQTAIAISNPSSSCVTVKLDLMALSGESTGLTATLTVPANEQAQAFLNQILQFETLQRPFQGILRIQPDLPVVSMIGLRLRYNERGEFLITTTSPFTENVFSSSAPQDLLFPHIADGGGFTTQFILLLVAVAACQMREAGCLSQLRVRYFKKGHGWLTDQFACPVSRRFPEKYGTFISGKSWIYHLPTERLIKTSRFPSFSTQFEKNSISLDFRIRP